MKMIAMGPLARAEYWPGRRGMPPDVEYEGDLFVGADPRPVARYAVLPPADGNLARQFAIRGLEFLWPIGMAADALLRGLDAPHLVWHMETRKGRTAWRACPNNYVGRPVGLRLDVWRDGKSGTFRASVRDGNRILEEWGLSAGGTDAARAEAVPVVRAWLVGFLSGVLSAQRDMFALAYGGGEVAACPK